MTKVNVNLNPKENSIVGIIKGKQELSSKEEAIKYIINLLKPEVTVKIKKPTTTEEDRQKIIKSLNTPPDLSNKRMKQIKVLNRQEGKKNGI